MNTPNPKMRNIYLFHLKWNGHFPEIKKQMEEYLGIIWNYKKKKRTISLSERISENIKKKRALENNKK